MDAQHGLQRIRFTATTSLRLIRFDQTPTNHSRAPPDPFRQGRVHGGCLRLPAYSKLEKHIWLMRGSGQVVKIYFSTSEDLFGVSLEPFTVTTLVRFYIDQSAPYPGVAPRLFLNGFASTYRRLVVSALARRAYRVTLRVNENLNRKGCSMHQWCISDDVNAIFTKIHKG